MSLSKRHFTAVVGLKENGFYISSSPFSAARKIVSKLCTSSKIKKVEFCVRETTQGSKKKTYGPYVGEMKKVKGSNKYKNVVYLKKNKIIHGGFKGLIEIEIELKDFLIPDEIINPYFANQISFNGNYYIFFNPKIVIDTKTKIRFYEYVIYCDRIQKKKTKIKRLSISDSKILDIDNANMDIFILKKLYEFRSRFNIPETNYFLEKIDEIIKKRGEKRNTIIHNLSYNINNNEINNLLIDAAYFKETPYTQPISMTNNGDNAYAKLVDINNIKYLFFNPILFFTNDTIMNLYYYQYCIYKYKRDIIFKEIIPNGFDIKIKKISIEDIGIDELQKLTISFFSKKSAINDFKNIYDTVYKKIKEISNLIPKVSYPSPTTRTMQLPLRTIIQDPSLTLQNSLLSPALRTIMNISGKPIVVRGPRTITSSKPSYPNPTINMNISGNPIAVKGPRTITSRKPSSPNPTINTIMLALRGKEVPYAKPIKNNQINIISTPTSTIKNSSKRLIGVLHDIIR